jgi:hypothetical protein
VAAISGGTRQHNNISLSNRRATKVQLFFQVGN